MGFIAQLASASKASLPDRDQGKRTWREVFGTDKETGKERTPVRGEGGSHGRSIASGGYATMRLLAALRSMAPGGWSDDRWEQTRHFNGLPYVAIHRIAMQWQQCEFQVFKKDPGHQDGKRPITENDPAEGGRVHKPYDLVKLLEKPNKQDSFGKIMYRWAQQKYLTGTALTWNVPNRLGTPMEMYCIPTAIAIPQPAVNPDFPDGYYRIQPVYPYGPFSSYPTPASAVGAAVPAQWMMRFQFPHPFLRYEGYSPLSAMRMHVDAIEMMDRSRHSSMRRGINPSAVLNFDDMEGLNGQGLPEEEIDRIHAEWENEFQGPENAGKLIVGTPGGKIEQFGQRPVDMDYQAGWDQLSSFILCAFGITKPVAGMVEDSSYSTLFASLKQVHMLTIKPDVEDVASDLTRDLGPYFGDDLIIEIRPQRIDDHDILFTKIDKGIQAKCLTKNDVLKLLELPVTQEEWGKDIAGDPSPNEQAQQQQQGMGGMTGAEGTPPGQQSDQEGKTANAEQEALQSEREAERPNPPEVENSRPRPGNLSRGALGPRKHLSDHVNGRKR